MEKQFEITIEIGQEMFNSNIPLLKEIALQHFSEEELNVKQLPKTWGMCDKMVGFYVNNHATVKYFEGKGISENMNIFATKEQAIACRSLAQLSQLMKIYNDGWIPNWNTKEFKYTIAFINEEIEIDYYQTKRHFLAFKTKELRDEFLTNFQDLILLAKPLL